MLTLDERLSAVVKELELGDKVADIGCDHGKIANSAVQITKNPAYAVDISAECLMKARTLSKELLQEDDVVCLVGDGLNPVKDKDVDTIVIAGMGAHEIVKILSDSDKRYVYSRPASARRRSESLFAGKRLFREKGRRREKRQQVLSRHRRGRNRIYALHAV